MNEPGRPAAFPGVRVECRATIGGEEIRVVQVVAVGAWSDPGTRDLVRDHIRHALMEEILRKFPPKVYVSR